MWARLYACVALAILMAVAVALAISHGTIEVSMMVSLASDSFNILDMVRELEWDINKKVETCKDDDTWAFGRFYINETKLRDDYSGGKSVGASTLKMAAYFALAYTITGNRTYLEWARRTLNFARSRMFHALGLPYEKWNLTTNSPSGEVHGYTEGMFIRACYLMYKLTGNTTYLSWAEEFFQALYDYCINKTTWIPAAKLNYTGMSLTLDWSSLDIVAHCLVEMAYLYEMSNSPLVEETAMRIWSALWSMRNKTTNIPPGKFRHTGEIYPGTYTDPHRILYIIYALLEWYRLTGNATLLSNAETLARALLKYSWIDALGRWRWLIYMDGTPKADYMWSLSTYFWVLIELSQITGNQTYADYALSTLDFIKQKWEAHARFDDFQTFDGNNTVYAWRWLPAVFSIHNFWFSFWLLKDISALDVILDWCSWRTMYRKSSWGYYFASYVPWKQESYYYIEACNFYLGQHYQPFLKYLAERLRGPFLIPLVGEASILSSDPLGFWYRDVLSLRLWVRMRRNSTSVLVITVPKKPTRVKISCSWRYEPKPTREAFEQARGPCWYWDEERGVLYVKVWGLNPPEEVIVDWAPAGYTDPPQEGEARGQGRPAGEAEQGAVLDTAILVASSATVLSALALMLRKRLRG